MCARLFRDAARPLPQAGQTKPSGQRRSNRNAAQLVSSAKLAWNSLRDRALATGRPLAPAACGWPRGDYTPYGAPWDNGISFHQGVAHELQTLLEEKNIICQCNVNSTPSSVSLLRSKYFSYSLTSIVTRFVFTTNIRLLKPFMSLINFNGGII